MHAATISRLIGLLCLGFGSSLIAPLLVALWYQDGQAGDFTRTLVLTVAAGLLALLVSGRSRITLRNRDGFLVVALKVAGKTVMRSRNWLEKELTKD